MHEGGRWTKGGLGTPRWDHDRHHPRAAGVNQLQEKAAAAADVHGTTPDRRRAQAFQQTARTGEHHYLTGRSAPTTSRPDHGPFVEFRPDGSAHLHDKDGNHSRPIEHNVVKDSVEPHLHAPAAPITRAPRTKLSDWSGDAERLARIQDGLHEDPRLAEMWRAQGFDGKPHVVSREDFDALPDDHIKVYRGLSGPQARRWAEEYRTGDHPFAGLGVHGSGTYTSTHPATADYYAAPDGAVLRMALRPGARITAERELFNRYRQELAEHGAETRRVPGLFEGDAGRIATAYGFDAIHVRLGPDESYYVVMNRSALIVAEGDEK